MERMADNLVQLMAQMAQHPDTPLAALDYLSDAQKQQLLADFNRTDKAYPQDSTVVQLLEAQAQQVPNKIAVVAADTTLYYGQLNETANQLAACLQQQGIAPGHLVAIRLPRSEWMVVAIVGILKAGAGYIPIDTTYPEERYRFIIGDSGCQTVVDEAWIREFIQQQQQYPTANIGPLCTPDATAYVIYTSGTTGLPKGTVVTHGSLANRIMAEADLLEVNEQTVTCLTTNYVFDVSLLELFLPLTVGGSLVIPTQAQVEAPDQLFTLIKDKAVTLLQGTPSFVLHILSGVAMEAGQMPALALRQLCIGGESLPPDMVQLLKSILPQVTINNHYGPTETTIDAIALPNVQSVERNIIGRPLPDTKVYVLDSRLQLMPVGVVGEICIGGAGVAMGYLNRPELTAEKFVNDPFVPGGRLYRTGDLGRWTEKGTIEFIGRKDNQVKIRGFRVELGEIETALQRYPGITAVAVTAQPNVHGQLDLVAYLTAATACSPAELQAFLATQLPAYMVPSYYVQVEAMPLGPTGKINRKMLLQLAAPAMGASAPYVAPRNETEALLVKIWQEVLGREQVGVKDHFFELGGHSLNAVQVISRINHQWGIKVNIHSVFTSPTIEQLSEEILFIKDQSERKKDKTDLFEIDL
jgi:tyrocidine synthetase III